MKRHFITWLSILLTLGGVHSVYWLTRFLWMATAEPAHRSVWIAQICTGLAISIFIGVSWISLLMLVIWREGQPK